MFFLRNWQSLVFVGFLFTSLVVSQQPITVDDANVYSLANLNGIQLPDYAGWTTVIPEGGWEYYDGTYTSNQAEYAYFSFFFRGTAIAHYADKGPNRGPVGVSVDGKPFTIYNWTNVGNTVEHGQQMWSITGLAEGDHQILVSNQGTGKSVMMGLDYLEITPGSDGNIIPATYGPGASSIPSNAKLIDGKSDALSFTSSWEQWCDGYCLNNWGHSSGVPGSVATFKFNGTAVWFFSDRYENNTIINISLDGAPAEAVDTSSPKNVTLSQVLTWSRTDLSDGPHVVTLTHAGPKDKWVNVDFFRYLLSASNTPSAGSTAQTRSLPVGPIVGGSVGGVALLAFIAGIFIWRRRHQRPQTGTTAQHESYVGDATYNGKGEYAFPSSPKDSSTPATPSTLTEKYWNDPGAENSVAPMALTGPTYTGYPEIH